MAEKDLSIWQILDIINTQYPDAMPILQKPGVADVYIRYIKAEPPWTTAQLQAELRATPYYQSTPQAARDNDILAATDPATYAERAAKVKETIGRIEAQLGIKLDTNPGGNIFDAPSFTFFVDAVKYGWDETEIRHRMLNSVNKDFTGGAGVATAAAQVARLANDYALPMSDTRARQYGIALLDGSMDQDAITGDLLAQAKSLYPTIADQLDRGITVRQWADPFLQIAQQELGVDPTSINLTDQKWLRMLNQTDPQTGDRVPMNIDQWLSTIRSDPTYGYATTAQGKASATTLATQLQQRMGAAA